MKTRKRFTLGTWVNVLLAAGFCGGFFECESSESPAGTTVNQYNGGPSGQGGDVGMVLVLVDKDNDSFAGAATEKAACDMLAEKYQATCLDLFDEYEKGGSGSVSSALSVGDCDDNDATTYPGAVELFDGKDNDCDGKMADGECKVGADCADGEVCTEFKCGPKPGCKVDADCDDTDACTTDTCDIATGKCASTPVTCDDKNLCTTDSCDKATGCVFTNNTVDCDDGNACTTGDVCKDGACVSGPATVCDDKDACTDDSCDPATGCVFTPKVCDDKDACTTDTCDIATGCVFTPVVCDDKDACTDDSCDPATGCVYTPKVCDDNDLCTTDSCDPLTGCVFTPIPGCCKADADCDDQSACTTDSCDIATGACSHAPVTCDDANACTDDSCDPAAGCVFTPKVCNDNDICTTDTCDPLTGCVFTPILGCCKADADCDDQSACTTDSCDIATGACSHAPVTCDDQSVCTTDTCDPATGCVYTPIVCDDGNLCTTDTCDPVGGCVRTTIVGCCLGGNDAQCAPWVPAGYLPVPGKTFWHLGPYSYGCIPIAGSATDKCGVCEDVDGDGVCALHEVNCADKVDGDFDGKTDCVDTEDCATAPVCQPGYCTSDAGCAKYPAEVCWLNQCTNVGGDCAPFQIKTDTGKTLEWYSAVFIKNTTATGAFDGPVTGACSVAVPGDAYTTCVCRTHFGDSPCSVLPASPGVFGCVHNQQPNFS